MQPFTARVIQIIKSIPAGKVMTYGQVARVAGSPRGARQVVRVLHSMSAKHHLPWHRVVNSKGELNIPDDESFEVQRLMLQMEDVPFGSDKRILIADCLYHPEDVQLSED